MQLSTIPLGFNVVGRSQVCTWVLNDRLGFTLGNVERLDCRPCCIARSQSNWVPQFLEDANLVPPPVPCSILQELPERLQPMV